MSSSLAASDYSLDVCLQAAKGFHLHDPTRSGTDCRRNACQFHQRLCPHRRAQRPAECHRSGVPLQPSSRFQATSPADDGFEAPGDEHTAYTTPGHKHPPLSALCSHDETGCSTTAPCPDRRLPPTHWPADTVKQSAVQWQCEAGLELVLPAACLSPSILPRLVDCDLSPQHHDRRAGAVITRSGIAGGAGDGTGPLRGSGAGDGSMRCGGMAGRSVCGKWSVGVGLPAVQAVRGAGELFL